MRKVRNIIAYPFIMVAVISFFIAALIRGDLNDTITTIEKISNKMKDWE